MHLEMPTLDIAKVAQAQNQLPAQVLHRTVGTGAGFQIPEVEDRRLLCVGRKRPKRSAAE
jgi:hypothetical protein